MEQSDFVSKKKKRNLWDTLIFLINLINYYYYWIPYHWLKLYLFHFIWSKKTFENRKTEEKEPSWRRARINVCSFPACLVSPYVSKKIRMPVVLSFFKGEMERERRGKGGGGGARNHGRRRDGIPADADADAILDGCFDFFSPLLINLIPCEIFDVS